MNKRFFFRGIALALSLGSFCYFLVFGNGGLKDCYYLRCENDTLKSKIGNLESKRDHVHKKIIAYKQGDFSREKLARQELLMGRGELVYLD